MDLQKSYKIVSLWKREINRLRLCHLIRKRIYGQWDILNKAIEVVDLMVEGKNNDYNIYVELHKVLKKAEEKEEDVIDYRSISRVEDIKKYLPKSYSSYLDIGCFDGSITSTISKYLRTTNKDLKTCGIDITQHYLGDDFEYKIYNGKRIPYDDNTFDVITIFMVLHHIRNLKQYLTEVFRVLNKGGVLIIREHDVTDNDLKDIINIQHHFYSIVLEEDDLDVCTYISKDKLRSVMEKVGFSYVDSTENSKSSMCYKKNKRVIDNPFQIFYSVFTK